MLTRPQTAPTGPRARGDSPTFLAHSPTFLAHSSTFLAHSALMGVPYLSLRKFPGFGADALHDSRCRAARVCHEGDAGLSPCARNTIREAISRDTSSSQHVQDTLCPKEPHAQRSWHLTAVTPPVQSEDLPPEVWLPTLSDDFSVSGDLRE